MAHIKTPESMADERDGAAAWVASVVLGGACGAVAGALMPNAITLLPELSSATNLSLSTVSHVVEVLVRHKLATRDGCGVRAASVPPAWQKLLKEFVGSVKKMSRK